MFKDDGKFLEWARQRTVAGDEPSMVAGNVQANNGNFGWNATTGQFGDLLKMRAVDSTSAARHALQNAACIAAMILTTDAMGVESPDEEKKTGKPSPKMIPNQPAVAILAPLRRGLFFGPEGIQPSTPAFRASPIAATFRNGRSRR